MRLGATSGVDAGVIVFACSFLNRSIQHIDGAVDRHGWTVFLHVSTVVRRREEGKIQLIQLVISNSLWLTDYHHPSPPPASSLIRLRRAGGGALVFRSQAGGAFVSRSRFSIFNYNSFDLWRIKSGFWGFLMTNTINHTIMPRDYSLKHIWNERARPCGPKI